MGGRTPFRVVLDTNILVRGLIYAGSASGRVLWACEDRHIIAVLSKSVVKEYRLILSDPELVSRYPQLEAQKMNKAIERLVYVGDVIRSPSERFDFPRDPKDAKLVELCIAARATHLITTDRDLLDLPQGIDDAAKRFRRRAKRIEVVEPRQFIDRYAVNWE